MKRKRQLSSSLKKVSVSEPATKQDFHVMQVQLDTILKYIGTLATKESVENLVKRMATKEDLEELKRHTGVLFEKLKYDVLGSLDGVRSNEALLAYHTERIGRIEHHLNLAA